MKNHTWKSWEHTWAENSARQRLHARIDGMVLNAHFAIHHMALQYLKKLAKEV